MQAPVCGGEQPVSCSEYDALRRYVQDLEHKLGALTLSNAQLFHELNKSDARLRSSLKSQGARGARDPQEPPRLPQQGPQHTDRASRFHAPARPSVPAVSEAHRAGRGAPRVVRNPRLQSRFAGGSGYGGGDARDAPTPVMYKRN